MGRQRHQFSQIYNIVLGHQDQRGQSIYPERPKPEKFWEVLTDVGVNIKLKVNQNEMHMKLIGKAETWLDKEAPVDSRKENGFVEPATTKRVKKKA